MVITRTEAKAAFDHVLDIVLDRYGSKDLKEALVKEGYVDILQVLTIDDETISSLVYQDPEDETKTVPIRKGDVGLLKCFKAFVHHRNVNGNPIADTDWVQLTQEEFDLFRIDPTNLLRVTSAATGSAKVTSVTSKYSMVDIFRRGIKRDPSLFLSLKDEKYNDNWHRSFETQARAQDVHNVLNPNYKPVTQEEMDLFIEQQKYVYAVLESKVLTDFGKSLVRDHEHDFDAQAVYMKLKAHHLKSTKAMIESSTILAYITSARLGTGEWKGTTESFILNWMNQVRLYERQVPPSDHFSDGQKRVMLEVAVHGLSELRQVKNNADLEKTKTGQSLKFDEYTSLLLSAASAYDSQFATKRIKHQVFSHEVFDHDDPDIPSDSFDIETSVGTIQAYAAVSHQAKSSTFDQKPRMSKEKWYSLSEKERLLWDQFDDKAKSIILGTDVRKSHFDARPQSNYSGSQSKRKANLHEISAFDFLQANLHDLSLQEPDEIIESDDPSPSDTNDNDGPSDSLLVNAAKTSHSKLPPGDIRRVMSKASTRSVNMARIIYNVSASKTTTKDNMSLVDRGANGGIAGNDVRVIFKQNRSVDISGIDNHQITDVSIGTVGGVVETHKGPVIAIMHQYALIGTGHSIHAPCQIEHFKNFVDEKSKRIGGTQCIKTLDGYAIPLVIQNGLARLKIRPYTDEEFDKLPHVFLTSESLWDPSVMDDDPLDKAQWYDAIEGLDDPNSPRFDEFGNYRHRVTVQYAAYFHRHCSTESNDIEDVIDHCVYDAQSSSDNTIEPIVFYDAYEHQLDDAEHFDPETFSLKLDPRTVAHKPPDYSLLRPFFGWFSTDTIKQTFEHTTQYARLPSGTLLKRTFKSSNPALNVTRRHESVACDIVYSDVPAVDSGATAAVIFTGLDTHVTDVYSIRSDKQFVNTLEDNIRYRGAPTRLISDRAQVEISQKVLDILRTLCIGDWQSEPHKQQQNPAERRFQTVKTAANRVMDRTGAPPNTWFLCLTYVCFLLNHTYNSSICDVPLNRLTGSTVDISVLLKFFFWQKVYYKKVDSGFPSESTEALGHIVGISEHCGHALTWKILTDDTQKVIYRSLVRPYSIADPNFRAVMPGGEEDDVIGDPIDPIIKSKTPSSSFANHDITTQAPPSQPPPPVFNPEELIGRTFLMDKQENGEVHRARIVQMIEDHESDVKDNPTMIKFRLSINNDAAEEIITYNRLLDYLTRDDESDVVWKFRRIVSHQGPLRSEHPDYKGSMYNVMVEWETGEITSEPLQMIAADDPVTCAIYAKDNGLLDLPGWKKFKSIAKRQKKFTRMVNQAKLKSYTNSPKYKYGFEVPRNYAHAMALDAKNKNTMWKDAADLEIKQIAEYKVFVDHGHHTRATPPSGYKKIRVHFVFDVKHDGRHKGRLVADGHLTDIPIESVYSGVVSLRGFRLVLFLGQLNSLEVWSTDIGNAYLEAMTSEKVYIIAGPEFGDLEGHILVIHKALYGLRSSGARWHDKFADCLRDQGFEQCKAEPDIWLRERDGAYDYIAVYVDDLAIAMKDPQEFISVLETKYKFKLKGTGPIEVHLGMTFQRDQDGVLCISATKFIEKMIGTYEKFFGEKPKHNVSSPLDKGDHPELDTSELLDSQGITIYQSLIGSLQWAVSIGRFDIHTAVMTLSGFRVAPRRGHLDRAKRICGYLSKMRHAAIRIRTDEPDYSDIPNFEYDWAQTIYGNVQECKPHDAPKPLGKHVTLTHYVDANLMHDITTGRSVTGILHLINKTPIDWYSKKQATVETATYGSEFVAARTCVEQIIDIRTTLYYLGVPVRSTSYMFGDNKSVVDSSTQVHAKLHKRHTMLSFHRVREAIASGMVNFIFINGDINPADILSKHWGYSQIWTQLKALLFWYGETDVDTDN
jgi:Reverse transcriptase (RNA-dependent DNA polymerase)